VLTKTGIQKLFALLDSFVCCHKITPLTPTVLLYFLNIYFNLGTIIVTKSDVNKNA